jgi:cobalt-precorrin 5A hydrolase
MSLGIVVRIAGPLAVDKRSDPAVVVVDDAGRFAVSVMGGHGAAANDMAKAVAATLGAMPVITTASDSWLYPAPDLIGREFGWKIERAENLTRVAAAIVRGQTTAIYQDAGSPDWWLPFGPLPDHMTRVSTWDEVERLVPAALLVISDRISPADPLPNSTVVYRPPTLVVGIGCKRGTSLHAIDEFVATTFAERGLSLDSLAGVATVTLKSDEPGLIEFARARALPLIAFSPEELDGQPGIVTPSERVRNKIGIAAVAEPAALRAAGAPTLLVPKQVGPGMTLAVARISHEATP